MGLNRLYKPKTPLNIVKKLEGQVVSVTNTDIAFELDTITKERNVIGWNFFDIDTLTVINNELNERFLRKYTYIENSYSQEYLNINTIQN